MNKYHRTYSYHYTQRIRELGATHSQAFVDLTNNGWVTLAGPWNRGKCIYNDKLIVIPIWAIEKDRLFAVHYLNHEVAHAIAGFDEHHSVKWLMKLTEICCCGNCPANEREYKPRTVSKHNAAFGGGEE